VPVGTQKAARVPTAIEDFLKQLLVCFRTVTLYPHSSDIPRHSGDVAADQLRALLALRAELRFVVAKDQLLYDDVPAFPGQEAVSALALEFYNRGVAEMRFHAGVSGLDIVSFFGLLKLPPTEIATTGGFETCMWERRIDTITIVEAHLHVREHIIDREGEAAIDPEEIERLLRGRATGSPVERRVLVRAVSNPAALSSYLEDQLARTGAVDAEDIRELAHVAAEQPTEERPALFRAVADALNSLDPRVRHELLVREILPEARTDEALATIVRQVDVDELCRALVEEVEEGRMSREGMARAIRNLSSISAADRADVIDAAGAAMRGAGFSGEQVGEVMEMVSPSRLSIRGSSQKADSTQPVDSIFQLMDLAVSDAWSAESDPALAELEHEARQGVTDGDILGTLVMCVTLAADADRWASIMTLLEDSLELLVARGEFEIASDAAEALGAAAVADPFTVVQQSRLKAAIGLLAKPQDVRALTRALEVFEPDSPTRLAALRLLDLLGDRAIGPMLDLLADEPDRSARKALVDLLGELSAGRPNLVAARITDPRWYVVRNVVSILGATKSPAAAGYLVNTLKHPDARVRRETIRALSTINDRTAVNLLVAALCDDDSQNVQIAARYLGHLRVRGAVTSLLQVARGEGRGNRETAPRVESVEALGRIGSPDAVEALIELAGRRGRTTLSKSREVAVAAEAALAHATSVGMAS
jgi:HEAT repeat protein